MVMLVTWPIKERPKTCTYQDAVCSMPFAASTLWQSIKMWWCGLIQCQIWHDPITDMLRCDTVRKRWHHTDMLSCNYMKCDMRAPTITACGPQENSLHRRTKLWHCPYHGIVFDLSLHWRTELWHCPYEGIVFYLKFLGFFVHVLQILEIKW